jgi:hypothetical protein
VGGIALTAASNPRTQEPVQPDRLPRDFFSRSTSFMCDSEQNAQVERRIVMRAVDGLHFVLQSCREPRKA